MTTAPAGYTYDEQLPASPVTEQDLTELLADVMWTDADARALRRAGEILAPQASDILDVWYDFIGSTPHLISVFRGPDGKPDQEYLERVRARFERWITDLCTRGFDYRWLAYQEEIGLRHTPAKKNLTDGVKSPSTYVPMRHLVALLVPITMTIREFLQRGESSLTEVEAMYQAWFKAATVSVTLWTRPYAAELW